MSVANIHDDEPLELRDHEGFRARRIRVGHTLGMERLGASVWELKPGQAAYPYHFHLTEEELVVVLAGRPSVRTPDGWRELVEGDLVSFPRSEARDLAEGKKGSGVGRSASPEPTS